MITPPYGRAGPRQRAGPSRVLSLNSCRVAMVAQLPGLPGKRAPYGGRQRAAVGSVLVDAGVVDRNLQSGTAVTLSGEHDVQPAGGAELPAAELGRAARVERKLGEPLEQFPDGDPDQRA